MVEPFDTPMVDFNEDSDIAMGGEIWLQPGSRMEEDNQDAYSHVESLEVDMMAYDETDEYEMGDIAVQMDQNVLDTEVPDISLYASPAPLPEAELVLSYENHHPPPLMPEMHLMNQVDSHLILDHGNDDTREQLIPQGSDASQAIPVFHTDDLHLPGPSKLGEVQDLQNNSYAVPDVRDEDANHAHSEYQGNTAVALLESSGLQERDPSLEHVTDPPEHALPQDDHQAEANADAPSLIEQVGAQETETNEEDSHSEIVATIGHGNVSGDEQEATTLTSHEVQDTDDITAHAATQEYDQQTESVLPEHLPPIYLTLFVASSESPSFEFVLFSLSGSSTDQHADDLLVVLQDQQFLFYEPISTVFDALRREDHIQSLEDYTEAEMAISVPGLHLAISEVFIINISKRVASG